MVSNVCRLLLRPRRCSHPALEPPPDSSAVSAHADVLILSYVQKYAKTMFARSIPSQSGTALKCATLVLWQKTSVQLDAVFLNRSSEEQCWPSQSARRCCQVHLLTYLPALKCTTLALWQRGGVQLDPMRISQECKNNVY